MNPWVIPAYLILGLFITINVLVRLFKTTGALTAAILRRILRLDLPENERKWLERLFTPVWIAVGIWSFLRLRNVSLITALFALFSFRSGGNVARAIIYSLHDRKLVRDIGGGGLLSRATSTILTVETLFIIGMTVTYKAVATVAGGSIDLLYLWVSGFAFGLLLFWIVARNNRGVLMKNVMSIVVFFSGKKGKETVERLRGKDLEERIRESYRRIRR